MSCGNVDKDFKKCFHELKSFVGVTNDMHVWHYNFVGHFDISVIIIMKNDNVMSENIKANL